ncbi:MAG: response regulator [Alphaproteobacteria bacterium]
MKNVASPALLKGARVLIVEDEVLVANYLEELLGMEGCIVLGPAVRVREALSMIECERPEVAVLNLTLRGERTTAVARALTARRVPFVVTTGYGAEYVPDEEVLQQAPRLGKPFRSRRLLRMLADTLAGAEH